MQTIHSPPEPRGVRYITGQRTDKLAGLPTLENSEQYVLEVYPYPE